MPATFRFFHVRVAAIQDLTPGFRRFTFTGDDLDAFADPGWDQRIKLVLPARDGGFDHLPTGDDWYARWRELDDAKRPIIRTYTTRAVRPERMEVDVDAVVHEVHGPAARFVVEARVGDEVVLLGPNAASEEEPGGVDFVPPNVTERYFLAGDETAAPAIAVILEQLPAEARGIAVVEVPSDDDTAYLPTHPGIEVRAVGRGGAPHGERLVEAARTAVAELAPIGEPQEVEEIDVDEQLLWEVPRHAKGGAALKRTSLYAWLASEAAAVKTLRRHLVSERGIDRRSVAFMGYWRLGKAEGL
ncbi:siderophore-interacting protein [Pseudoclavibacter chungangensis]|uniref:Siderophore-interacting protein n=1 Tax=Pseudoclavibacter chungangensis TaxID=587635 RepID=A0A7J5BMQ5_9MICO|nr:siderophore-interacting protein [Pseudoclavibacter chungangensis]KAB1652486.1 siderophore-interacting protein [Pseudoclavibacter chungangensis]NYJ66073.1 NADPH-dependent ferric siderophore reductase [Pseudoclavibacter chungangensis]